MKRRQAGFSLAEIAVALGLMVVGIYLVNRGMDSMYDLADDTLSLSANERQINVIADNIRLGLENYQVNFAYDNASMEEQLRVPNLPMAWDVGISAEREKCPDCRGHYGYSIQMLEQYRGLFLVTLRVTHKDWREPYRDYKFVVTLK